MNSKRKTPAAAAVPAEPAAATLDELMTAIRHFSAGIAHDLNNPLTPLLFHLGTLAVELRGQERLRAEVEGAMAAAERMREFSALLQNLSGTATPRTYPVSVNTAVRDSMAGLLAELSGKTQIEIALCDEDVYIACDDIRVQMMIRHLILNARDAMSTGGKVTLRTRAAGTEAAPRVAIEAQDNGAGIAPAERPHMFKPYHPLYGRKEHGKGWSLTVLYLLTRQAGGAIECESEPGKGTTIRLLFAREDRPVQVVTDAAAPGHPFRVPLLLVVERDEAARQALAGALEGAGFRTLAAGGADEARAAVAALGDPVRIVVCEAALLRKNFRPGALAGAHAGARWVATGAAGAAPDGCAGAVADRDPGRVVAEVRRVAGH